MPRGEKMMLPSERFVVPLQEGKSIGLELDFSAEVRQGARFRSVGEFNILHHMK